MKTENGWVIDENNNRASIEYWVSEEAAMESLETLTNCSNCSDCRSCSNCSYCRSCSDCRSCSYCRSCSEKSDSKLPPVPVIADIHNAVLSAVTKDGCALDMSAWHACETSHCRAGWVVFLAGKEGKSLEDATSTLFAAMQIYQASGYEISPCRFFDSDEEAMADMKRLAELEQK